MNITLNINNRRFECLIDPSQTLLKTLRDLGIKSVRRGCDSSSCGVCSVIVDGKIMPACTLLSARMEGKNIITVDGIQSEAAKIAAHFSDQGADQCGFCNPAIALSAYLLKQEAPNADDALIRHTLVGHLCRCSGYVSQVKAIKSYLKESL